MYDLIVTPEKIQSHGIESQPFLPDQVFLSVPSESKLAGLDRVSLKDIPVMYYVSFLQAGKAKVKKFLVWSKEVKKRIKLI